MKYLKSKFKAFVISCSASDYEKIKAENKELKQDIYNLIRKENEADGIKTKIRWKMAFDIDDMILFGDGIKNDAELKGILS